MRPVAVVTPLELQTFFCVFYIHSPFLTRVSILIS